MSVVSPGFFVTGGTVPPNASSYIEREADRELFEALSEGQYCYVLNSRQMGKSSLAVRTIAKLAEAGIACAFIDLTRLGSASVTADQWYSGLVVETGRALECRAEALAYLQANKAVGAVQRFLGFLSEVAIRKVPGPIVVMIDEIDAVRSLTFSTDDLFAGIRQLHNGRAHDPDLNRLTFCLLGAALPSDLIQDPRTTPFNVGKRVDLKDFTRKEAMSFAAAMGPDGQAKLERVFHWTGGHPYLTQTLCNELATQPRTGVDELVRRRYLDARAKDSDTNLADVANRLMGRGDPNVSDEDRANVLSQYQALIKGRPVTDDEANPALGRIKLSGVARVEGGRLKPRNLIYATIFGPAWILENMPGQELRRQRKAFWKGALRTALISGAIILVVAFLGGLALINARRANAAEGQRRRERDQARYDGYAADMRNMHDLYADHNLMLMRLALERHKDDPWRGWEWRYWNWLAHRSKQTIDLSPLRASVFLPSPDGRLGLAEGNAKVAVFDISSGKILRQVSTGNACWYRDGTHFLVFGLDGSMRVYGTTTGRLERTFSQTSLPNSFAPPVCSLPGDRTVFVLGWDGSPGALDMKSGQFRKLRIPKGCTVSAITVATSGRLVAWIANAGAFMQQELSHLALYRPGDSAPFADLLLEGTGSAVDISPDGHWAAVGTQEGDLKIYDLNTLRRVSSQKLFSATVGQLCFSADSQRILVTGSAREAVMIRLHAGLGEVVRRFPEANNAYFLPRHRLVVTYWKAEIFDESQAPDVMAVRLGPQYGGCELFDKNTFLVNTSTDYRLLSLSSGRLSKSIPLTSGTTFHSGVTLGTLPSGDCVSLSDKTAGVRYIVKHGDAIRYNPGGAGFAITVPNVGYRVFYKGAAGLKEVPLNLDESHWPVSFSNDGRVLVVTDAFGKFTLYDLSNGKKIWTQPDTGDSSVRQAAFSPDGRTLATAQQSDVTDLWDIPTGRKLFTLLGHSETVNTVAWSPDGTRLATGADDGTIHIWDAATGADLGVIGERGRPVTLVHFLPEGGWLASYSADGVARIWKSSDQP